MRLPLALFLLALAVRGLTAVGFGDPAYPDSFYYVNLARGLAAGNGLQVDYIWNFVEVGGRLPAEGVLPIPSNAHWMPLAALVQVPFIWLLGPTTLASGLPFWLAAALAAPLTWAIGRDAGLSRLTSAAGGLLVAVPGAASPFLAQPDNFGLFMLLGALSLWACARALRGDGRWFVLGGALVGLATLSRNDGLLLGVPFALAFLIDLARRLRSKRTGASRTYVSRIGWRAALLFAGAFLLVTAPWWLRQLQEFGSLSPSSASGRILWITEYRELYSVSSETTVDSFLSQGPAAILSSRLAGLAAALGIFATGPLLITMVPFVIIGAWSRRHDSAFTPWMMYAATLFAFSALVFAVHVPQGTFLHSCVALLPHAYLLGFVGIERTVRAVAARRRSWDPQRASRGFAVIAVGAMLLGAVGASVLTTRSWGADHAVREGMAEALAEVPPGERLMSPDPGAYRYHAGRAGIVTPDDPLPVIEAALRTYGIRWLVLERAHIVEPLIPVMKGEVRPAWLSSPVFSLASETPIPRAALYAVCFQPADTRCDA
ncbi:MAG: glycosyltransferase family 39 protein [Chloroflexota bacterium]|nr:glycosyltransferase family 39 protein [Chloroflexota bacterium]